MSFHRRKYCQIKSCPNNRGTVERTFRVPRCDPLVRDKWIQAIKDHDPGFQEKTAQFVSVCQQHFDSNDIYVSNGKSRVVKLKPGAYPKYFVDPLGAENRSNDILEKAEQPISAQVSQNNVRLVKIVVKKDTNNSNGVKTAAACKGCIDSEAEIQATRQKIADVDHELAEQRNEIAYLKKAIKFISKPRLQLGICELCQKRLPSEALHTHYCINNGQTSIQCGYCSLMFESTSKLLEHLKVFHDDKTFVECNICNAKFEMDALLEVHRTIHENGLDDLRHFKKDNNLSNGYQCGSCGEIVQTARTLRSHKKRQHLNVQHNEKLFECYVCKEPLGSMGQVRYHLANGHRSSIRCTVCKCLLNNYQINHHLCRSGNSIKCEYCSKTFLSVVSILKHLEKDHDHTKTVHKCHDCKKYYYMKSLLDFHSIFHETNEKSHVCYVCGKYYFSADQLSVHIRNIHTTEKSFLCVHCGSTFKRRYDLKIHLESHADRILKCDQCPMVFRHLRSLNSHKEQHSKVNYVCGTCNVELKTKFTFRDHMRKHNGQTDKKKHECSLCSRKFAFKTDLIVHNRKHTGEKPIECQYCDSKFRYETSLKIHLRTHFGKEIYFCKKQDCEERFQFAKELQEHLAEHYKSELETLKMDTHPL